MIGINAHFSRKEFSADICQLDLGTEVVVLTSENGDNISIYLNLKQMQELQLKLAKHLAERGIE